VADRSWRKLGGAGVGWGGDGTLLMPVLSQVKAGYIYDHKALQNNGHMKQQLKALASIILHIKSE
jgi:hypothetical protein